MQQRTSPAQTYTCPMHAGVRHEGPGLCPKCSMKLIPEGTRFGLFRHMISSPVHVTMMIAAMIALMIGTMLMR